jgi:hypothetical protein
MQQAPTINTQRRFFTVEFNLVSSFFRLEAPKWTQKAAKPSGPGSQTRPPNLLH